MIPAAARSSAAALEFHHCVVFSATLHHVLTRRRDGRPHQVRCACSKQGKPLSFSRERKEEERERERERERGREREKENELGALMPLSSFLCSETHVWHPVAPRPWRSDRRTSTDGRCCLNQDEKEEKEEGRRKEKVRKKKTISTNSCRSRHLPGFQAGAARLRHVIANDISAASQKNAEDGKKENASQSQAKNTIFLFPSFLLAYQVRQATSLMTQSQLEVV